MGTPTPGRTGRNLTTLILIGAPVTLWPATGLPGPRLPTGPQVREWISEPLTPGFLAALAVTVAWMLWGLLAAEMATHLQGWARRRLGRIPRFRVPGPLQGLTAALLGATVVTAATGGTSSAALSAAADTATPPSPQRDESLRDAGPSVGPDRDGSEKQGTVVVRRGDTLSGIAARRLDDPDRWRDIYTINRGTRFHTGGALTDPDVIHPGWKLRLPASSTRVVAPGPAVPAPDSSSPRSGPAPSPDASAGPSAGPAATDTTTTPEPPLSPVPDLSSPACDTPSRPTSGQWIDEAVAAAVLAAVAAVWAHRRHRSRVLSPSSRRDDPNLTPMPAVVARLRRAFRPDTASPALAADGDPTTPPHEHETGPKLPAAPASGQPVIGWWPAAGIGLTGPGADSAARGFLVAALSAGVDDPHARGTVVTTRAVLTRLLGAATVESARLVVADDAAQALAVIDQAILARTRACHDADVDTVPDLRRADPTAGPLPPVLFLTDSAQAELAALLVQAHHLDIHGVVLGDWPAGVTLTVADDGTLTGELPLDVDRLTVVDQADTVDLITTLAESHGIGVEPPPPHPATDGAPPPAEEPTPRSDQAGTPPPELTSPPDADDSPRPATRGPVTITVLGQPAITSDQPPRPLRAKALELLVYLAVHDGTATTEAILDDLLPDAPARTAGHRLHTYVSALRTALRHHGGPGTYLTHPAHRYTLNPDLLDIDLWRMRNAIRAADHATTAHDRVTHLRRAVEASRRPLADGCDYDWIEPHREAVRRQSIDATLALANALDGRPAEQVTILTTAIAQHPHTESLYQAAMRAHAALSQPDAVRALRRDLTRRLADIDTEPTDATLALADQLTATHPGAGISSGGVA
ncbi:BTAD domain-containing putative transcriptional regulator [Micromonospora fluostatini]|uniref:BTAD domain-containing putative transcriptional regulator n=1 Tax=Micromonospora sp. JCM 30529 TaxID=3421643 RepID=UPI003D178D68